MFLCCTTANYLVKIARLKKAGPFLILIFIPKITYNLKRILIFWATSSVVERVTDNDEVDGPIPSSPTIILLIPSYICSGFTFKFR